MTSLNQQAKSLLGSGICIIENQLVANDTEATAALKVALGELIYDKREAMIGSPVRLPRTGRLPLLTYPMALTNLAANPFADCVALLVLADPEKRSYPPEAVLCSAFNLTVAEARLVSRLATGEAIETASNALSIAVGTARNQLKSVFAKTGIRRQPELVAMLAALLAQFFGGA